MTDAEKSIPDLSNEVVYQTSRSSGAGGQNVNKVNTRVELRFDIGKSKMLDENQKTLLFTKYSSKINSDGILIVVSQKERSQLLNKEDAFKKFCNMLAKAFKPVRKRRPTQPTKASVEKRLTVKKIHSEKKSLRGKIR